MAGEAPLGDLNWLRDVALLALVTLMGVLGFLLRSIYKTFKEDLSAVRLKVEIIEVSYISKETLLRMDKDWKDEVTQMRAERRENDKENGARHVENRARLDDVKDSLVRLVELTVLMSAAQKEIESLRDAKHDIAAMVQNHEGRLHFLEKP